MSKDIPPTIREAFNKWASAYEKLGKDGGPEPIEVYEAAHELIALLDEAGECLHHFVDDEMTRHRIGAHAGMYFEVMRRK